MLRLIIDSDLHFKEGAIRPDKSNNLPAMRAAAKQMTIDAIICAGDLTDHGTDGKSFLCWQYGGADDQLTPLKKFIDDANDLAPAYVCEGNHDQYVPWPYIHKGVRSYVESRHGGRTYAWTKAKGGVEYRFICLGVYPDGPALEFLANELSAHPDKNIVLYWHYNVEGAYSDWWSDDDKKKLLAALEPHRSRVRLIIVGHRHESYLIKWNDYNVASGAGSDALLCTIDAPNGFAVSIQSIIA